MIKKSYILCQQLEVKFLARSFLYKIGGIFLLDILITLNTLLSKKWFVYHYVVQN